MADKRQKNAIVTPAVSRVVKPVFWGMVTLILLVIFGYIAKYSGLLDKLGFSAEFATRLLAILDSLSSSLLFFCAIGIATFIASVKRPEDDPFSLRIKYLFGGSASHDPKISEFLEYEVQKISAVCNKVSYDITISDIKEREQQDSNIFDIVLDINVRVELSNLMKNEVFDHKIPLSIWADPSIKELDEELGELFYVQLYSDKKCNDIELVKPTKMTDKVPNILQMVGVVIPMDGKAEYKYRYRKLVRLFSRYSGARDAEGILNLKANNFTSEANFSILNESGGLMSVQLLYEGNKDPLNGARELRKDQLEPVTLSLSNWYPDKSVELHWKYNRYGHNH